MRVRVIARGLAASWIFASLAPGLALAREANSKENNTKAAAVGLTAASVVLLSKKNTRNTGVVTGAAAAYAWKKHHDYVVQRHKETPRKYSRTSPSFRTYKKASATPKTTVVYVPQKNGKKHGKPGPNGRAVGYYTRSAHATSRPGVIVVSSKSKNGNGKETGKVVKKVVKELSKKH